MTHLIDKERSLKILFWAPRVLGIVFIMFLAIFALDVFEPGKSINYYVVALLMHLVPNFILTALLFIAWKHEKVGGIAITLIAVCFTLFFKTYREPMSFILISLPVFTIGLLFLLHNSFEEKEQ